MAATFAQGESNALVRPKYVRRQDLLSGDYVAGERGESGDGQELGVWTRAGVAISRLLEGKGAVFALCRKCRKTKKGQVREDGRAKCKQVCTKHTCSNKFVCTLE